MLRTNLALDIDTRQRKPAAKPQLRNRQPNTRAADRFLVRYIDGWAEANAAKIADAVSADYRFVDPLVGRFDRNTLSRYFAILRQRVGFDSVPNQRCKIHLGALASPQWPAGRLRFWRSLPECGLAGLSEVEMRAGRVSRETVSYDLNIATEWLRGSA